MTSKAEFKSKEGQRCLSHYGSYPPPTFVLEKLSEESATVRSKSSLHQTEIPHQVSAMAGAVRLRPSFVPRLVKSSTTDDGHLLLVTIYRTGDPKLLTFSSEASSPALNPQPASCSPSEMFELLNQILPQSGRRTTNHLSLIGKPNFPLVGLPALGPLSSPALGPLSFSSPATKDDLQFFHLRLPRFDQNSNLVLSSQSRDSFMKPFARRLHLGNKLSLLLAWLKKFSENLLLASSRTLVFESSNLNELGIMIQSIRNCDYRGVFMLPSSSRLIHKPVKLPLINFLKFPLKNLKTSGIMISIQCSGGYHNRFKRFTPEPNTASNPITISNQSIINRVLTIGKAPLRVPALAFSTLPSLRSKTVAIFSSIEVFMEEASLFLDLTGSKTLARSWFIALKFTISMTLIYLYLFVVLALGIAISYVSLIFEPYVVCCVLC